MKRYIGAVVAVALASLSFAGCQPIAAALLDEVFIDYPYIEEPLAEVWPRAAAFRYEAESDSYWKSPREMDSQGAGDCEDFAAWMVYHLGREARCAMIHRHKDPEGVNHAVVVYEGHLLEPQKVGKYYTPDEYIPIAEISYDAVMKASTEFYTK